MSKIGKQPISIKDGVIIATEGRKVTVTGPKGTLTYEIPVGLMVTVADGKITVTQEEKMRDQTKALFGLASFLINNMVIGVSDGFSKRLELVGVGYRSQITGKDLTLSLGFSHPVKIPAPEGIIFTIIDNNVVISGIDKALVGNTAAQIRAIRPPEPYKGKGIKYKGEKIRRKAGKAAKTVGTK